MTRVAYNIVDGTARNKRNLARGFSVDDDFRVRSLTRFRGRRDRFSRRRSLAGEGRGEGARDALVTNQNWIKAVKMRNSGAERDGRAGPRRSADGPWEINVGLKLRPVIRAD